MSKQHRIGDKFKCLEDYSRYGVPKGDIVEIVRIEDRLDGPSYTVRNITTDKLIDGTWAVSPIIWEKLEMKEKTELEQLVIDFNKGIEARKILASKYKHKCRYVGNGYTGTCTHYSSSIKKIEIIPEKPKKIWTPLKVDTANDGSYSADMQIAFNGPEIVIGCKTYNARELKAVLDAMVGRNCNSYVLIRAKQGNSHFYATKKGIYSADTNVKDKVLVWESCELLHKALTEFLKEE